MIKKYFKDMLRTDDELLSEKKVIQGLVEEIMEPMIAKLEDAVKIKGGK